MYLANKVQNIQGSADTLLDLAGLDQDEIRPVAEAMERGGRLAAKAKVTDAILDKCKPIAGHTGGLHRGDRGVPRRGVHARHARALGRRPPRSDPALRREGASQSRERRRRSILARSTRVGSWSGRRGRVDAQLHRLRAGDGRAHARRPRPGDGSPGGTGSRSRTGGRTSWRPGRDGRRVEPHAQRPHGHVVLRTRALAGAVSAASSRVRSSKTGGCTASGSRTYGRAGCYLEALRAR